MNQETRIDMRVSTFIKRRIKDEALRKGMKMSEYILECIRKQWLIDNPGESWPRFIK